MCGEHRWQDTMFSYVAPEARVPECHPLRPIRAMVGQALAALDAEFEPLYSHTGGPVIPPEYLLRATLYRSCAMKRFRPKDGSGSGSGPGRNSERDFHGEKRSNETNASERDPETRFYRKSRARARSSAARATS